MLSIFEGPYFRKLPCRYEHTCTYRDERLLGCMHNRVKQQKHIVYACNRRDKEKERERRAEAERARDRDKRSVRQRFCRSIPASLSQDVSHSV